VLLTQQNNIITNTHFTAFGGSSNNGTFRVKTYTLSQSDGAGTPVSNAQLTLQTDQVNGNKTLIVGGSAFTLDSTPITTGDNFSPNLTLALIDDKQVSHSLQVTFNNRQQLNGFVNKVSS
jgi:hypothetical protein